MRVHRDQRDRNLPRNIKTTILKSPQTNLRTFYSLPRDTASVTHSQANALEFLPSPTTSHPSASCSTCCTRDKSNILARTSLMSVPFSFARSKRAPCLYRLCRTQSSAQTSVHHLHETLVSATTHTLPLSPPHCPPTWFCWNRHGC